MLREKPDNKLEWVIGDKNGDGSIDRDTYLQRENNSYLDLKAGIYWVYIQTEWHEFETPDPASQYLSINSYGSSKVTFMENESENWPKKEVLT